MFFTVCAVGPCVVQDSGFLMNVFVSDVPDDITNNLFILEEMFWSLIRK